MNLSTQYAHLQHVVAARPIDREALGEYMRNMADAVNGHRQLLAAIKNDHAFHCAPGPLWLCARNTCQTASGL